MSDSSLLMGDRVPPFLGFTHTGHVYTSEEQTGRTVVLILVKNMGDGFLPSLIEAFSAREKEFADAHADIAALIGEKVEQVFEYSLAHPANFNLVGSLNYFNFPEHVAFDRETPVVLVVDRNMRVMRRIDKNEDAAEVVAEALAAARAIPHEAVRDIILPAPVLLMPNLFEPEFCKELIDIHKTGPTFESSTVSLGGDGKTRVKINPDTKIREDFLLKPEHPLFSKVKDIVMNRCGPEIKRAFQVQIVNTDIFLIAKYPGGGGHFKRHRDNRPKEVAFRRFAFSVNLTDPANAFEGGYIRLPEFNMHHYRCPQGTAIVFSVALLHEITPVIKGDRYVLVTHMFDEEGERERLATEGRGGAECLAC